MVALHLTVVGSKHPFEWVEGPFYALIEARMWDECHINRPHFVAKWSKIHRPPFSVELPIIVILRLFTFYP